MNNYSGSNEDALTEAGNAYFEAPTYENYSKFNRVEYGFDGTSDNYDFDYANVPVWPGTEGFAGDDDDDNGDNNGDGDGDGDGDDDDDEEVAINEIASERADNVIFDLQGRRILKATNGLYIVNGKKTVLK